MNTAQAVETLWSHGYRANASSMFAGYVTVMDPVVVRSGGAPDRVIHEKRTIHASQVWHFINERT